MPAVAGLDVVLFTDGIWHSGRRSNLPPIDLDAFGREFLGSGRPAQEIADRLLLAVMERDLGKPNDDMAVVALSLREGQAGLPVRRMSLEVQIA